MRFERFLRGDKEIKEKRGGGGGIVPFIQKKILKVKMIFFSLFCVSLFVHVRWKQVEILDRGYTINKRPKGGGMRIPLTLETVPSSAQSSAKLWLFQQIH